MICLKLLSTVCGWYAAFFNLALICKFRAIPKPFRMTTATYTRITVLQLLEKLSSIQGALISIGEAKCSWPLNLYNESSVFPDFSTGLTTVWRTTWGTFDLTIWLLQCTVVANSICHHLGTVFRAQRIFFLDCVLRLMLKAILLSKIFNTIKLHQAWVCTCSCPITASRCLLSSRSESCVDILSVRFPSNSVDEVIEFWKWLVVLGVHFKHMSGQWMLLNVVS